MTSKMAQSVFKQWQDEGLPTPDFEDIIILNNLGLKVERNSQLADFAYAPRCAYLGDLVLREPTIGKQLWIDIVRPTIEDDFKSQLYFMVFALACPQAELPSVVKSSQTAKAIKKFVQDELMGFTPTQMLAAIDWCMNGNKPEIQKYLEKPDIEVDQIQGESASLARTVWMQCISAGMDGEACKEATCPELERMFTNAMMSKGADVLKTEGARAAGDFYMTVGKIHKKLMEKKENGES